MSDVPRRPDDESDATERSAYDATAEPVTGAPAGAAESPSWSSGPSAGGRQADSLAGLAGSTGGGVAGGGAAGAVPGGGTGAGGGAPGAVPVGGTGAGGGVGETDPGETGAGGNGDAAFRVGRSPVTPKRRGSRRFLTFGAAPSGPPNAQERRRRRLFVTGISIGAAIIVIALCAGALGVIDAISDARDRAADSRDDRRQGDAGCLELEKRLNRLIPPGATTTPAARATAVRDENAAVRLYLAEPPGDRWVQDAWRQLLDARTVYADALDRQAKSRTPAFYVAPRAGGDRSVADELAGRSPAPCAGPIRRLAAPEL